MGKCLTKPTTENCLTKGVTISAMNLHICVHGTVEEPEKRHVTWTFNKTQHNH